VKPVLFIRRIEESDREWAREILSDSWGSTKIVSRGVIHEADQLPGFVALLDGLFAGLLTYDMKGAMFEITSLNVLEQRRGIGSALIESAIEEARSLKCLRVWVITTNDNIPAIEFYQANGFKIANIHKDAIIESRKLKPEIPHIGINGVPIKDEIELERMLDA
jgi:ribosomal protein S18 acetylase RimI-like enzyme